MKPTILTLATLVALAVTAGTADAQQRVVPGVTGYPAVGSSPYTYGYRPYPTFGHTGPISPYAPYTMSYGVNYGYSYGMPLYNYNVGYNYSYYSSWPGPYYRWRNW